MFKFFLSIFICICFACAELTKEEKLLYLNTASTSFLIAYGIAVWDYGQNSPKRNDEGYFGATTKHGGADKTGHLYTAYTLSHLYAFTYEEWGYTQKEAALYGSLSSFAFTGLMELGDSFSAFGYSQEDMYMNTLGSLLGYLTYNFPSLQDKVDLRLEYYPKEGVNDDILTDYESMKHLIAIKAAGFESLRTLRYLELHLGYFVRQHEQSIKERNHYVGIGINLSELLFSNYRRTPLNYLQLPYTYISYEND